MVTLEQLIGVVSPSRLDTAQRCMAQFFFRYVQRLPERWRSSLSYGRAVDACGSEVYAHKLEHATTPSVRDVQERFAAAWDYEADGVDVWEDGASKGKLLDVGVRAVGSWRDAVAVSFVPHAVQERLERTIAVGDDSFTLQGVLDVRGSNADGVAVVADIKTAGKAYAQSELLRRSQPHAYTLLTGLERFEFHVLLTTKDAATQVIGGDVPRADADAWARRASMTRRSIAHAYQTGDWLPNRQHFLCTQRHCEFWTACERTFGGRVAP